MIKYIPSIASANPVKFGHELLELGSSFENLHIDIEDGNFVPNITFGFKTIRKIREITDKPFSVHLMAMNPAQYLGELAGLNCSHIFIHVEGQMYLLNLINTIKAMNIKAGIALNPVSNIYDYQYLLKEVDAVLYLTSEPDQKGEIFNGEILKKIMPKNNLDYEIWLDGGIKRSHMTLLERYGVDYCVIGRDLFNSPNPGQYLDDLNRNS
jgi:Pentose-5-phosphate-3-epimerase